MDDIAETALVFLCLALAYLFVNAAVRLASRQN